jgi:hypothetical protein
MSAAQFDWPASDTLAAARQVRYLGWTCRTDHAVGGAESDPERPPNVANRWSTEGCATTAVLFFVLHLDDQEAGATCVGH